MASQSDSEIASALGRLEKAISDGMTTLDVGDLIAGARDAERLRAVAPEISGRLLAELHGREHSWPEIARMTGISQSTCYRRAEPYLPPDDA